MAILNSSLFSRNVTEDNVSFRMETNIADVTRDLRGIQDKVFGKIEGNLKVVGKFLQRESRRNAPEDTGRLKRGIRYRTDRRGVEIYVKSDIPYAAFMHYNTRYKPRKGGGPRFISRAINENEDTILRILGDLS